jgi:hypothetical protein
MTTPTSLYAIGSAPQSPPDAPVSSATESMLDSTIVLLNALDTIAAELDGHAPRSAAHLRTMRAALARFVLDWITEWPS